ncbi:hypothetical protein [Ferrimonas marina]|nr:hypothetical protein [Ferrimonas marina]
MKEIRAIAELVVLAVAALALAYWAGASSAETSGYEFGYWWSRWQ